MNTLLQQLNINNVNFYITIPLYKIILRNTLITLLLKNNEKREIKYLQIIFFFLIREG